MSSQARVESHRDEHVIASESYWPQEAGKQNQEPESQKEPSRAQEAKHQEEVNALVGEGSVGTGPTGLPNVQRAHVPTPWDPTSPRLLPGTHCTAWPSNVTAGTTVLGRSQGEVGLECLEGDNPGVAAEGSPTPNPTTVEKTKITNQRGKVILLNKLLDNEKANGNKHAHVSQVSQQAHFVPTKERSLEDNDAHSHPMGILDLQDLHLKGLWTLTQSNVEATGGELPAGLELHSATAEKLQHHVKHNPNAEPDILIFTDGSAGRNKENQPAAAWAFAAIADINGEHELVGWDHGQVCVDENSPEWLGATTLSAETAETAALQQACKWCIATQPKRNLGFFYDNCAVGHASTGWWTLNHEKKDQLHLRALMQLIEHMLPGKVHSDHIKAHNGHPYNELVDTLANHARMHGVQSRRPQEDLRDYIQGPRPSLHWWWAAWQMHQRDKQFPHMVGNLAKWPAFTQIPTPEQAWPEQTATKCQMLLGQLKIVQYNVCTMASKGNRYAQQDGINHYAALLRQQLTKAEVHIAGFQETRTRSSSVILSHDWARYTSAATAEGRGGCEIWIARSRSIGTKENAQIDHEKITVVKATPEILILRGHIGRSEIILVTGHAPHTGRPKTEIETWWTELTEAVSDKHRGLPVIAMMDANTHFASAAEPHVGEHQLERTQSTSAEMFINFLRQTSSWAANTYDTHEGDPDTWTHPHGTTHRCDYICLPLEWQNERNTRTWVECTLDTGRLHADHRPLWCIVNFQLKNGYQHRQRKAMIDVKKIGSLSQEEIQHIFDQLDKVEWHTTTHEHAETMIRQIRCELTKAVPAQRKPPRSSYISEWTWELRNKRVDLRRGVDRMERCLQRLRLSYILNAWQGCKHATRSGMFQQRLQTLAKVASTWKLLHDSQKSLNKSLRQDRAQQLEKTAKEAARMPGHKVYEALKRAGVVSKKNRQGFKPLPVLEYNGTRAETWEEQQTVWRRFFEEQEDGIETTPQQILQECWNRQKQRWFIPKLGDIPTLIELEAAMRTAKPGRAHYFDDIPPELLHMAPKHTANALYPLLLKQGCTLQEPISFKGGILVSAYKHKGSMTQPENYRSLLISSTLAKSFHRAMRAELNNTFDSIAAPLQCGGRPKKGVAQTAQAMIMFASSCRRQRISHAILFLDVKQAYYRLCRQIIVQTTDIDQAACRLFHELQMPTSSFGEFHRQLQKDNAFQMIEGKQYHAKYIDEVLNSTWFCLKHNRTPSLTRRGSRPGDSLAVHPPCVFMRVRSLDGTWTDLEWTWDAWR